MDSLKPSTQESCSRELTVVELLKGKRSKLIRDLQEIEDAINHFDNTSQFEQQQIRTIYKLGSVR